MPNGPVCECHLNIDQQDHLETEQMAAILVIFHMLGTDALAIANNLKTKQFEKWRPKCLVMFLVIECLVGSPLYFG